MIRDFDGPVLAAVRENLICSSKIKVSDNNIDILSSSMTSMQSKEVNNLDKADPDKVGKTRSGLVRVPLGNEKDQMYSTTTSGNHDPPYSEVSSIQGNDSARLDVTVRTVVEGMEPPVAPSYVETPVGGNLSHGLRQQPARTSEDDFEDEGVIEDAYNHVISQIKSYGTELDKLKQNIGD